MGFLHRVWGNSNLGRVETVSITPTLDVHCNFQNIPCPRSRPNGGQETKLASAEVIYWKMVMAWEEIWRSNGNNAPDTWKKRSFSGLVTPHSHLRLFSNYSTYCKKFREGTRREASDYGRNSIIPHETFQTLRGEEKGALSRTSTAQSAIHVSYIKISIIFNL
jgi:hypothetical protein